MKQLKDKKLDQASGGANSSTLTSSGSEYTDSGELYGGKYNIKSSNSSSSSTSNSSTSTSSSIKGGGKLNVGAMNLNQYMEMSGWFGG